jgi:hypothetical protein
MGYSETTRQVEVPPGVHPGDEFEAGMNPRDPGGLPGPLALVVPQHA